MATYTHGHADSVLRSHRWRTVENSAPHLLPHLRPGQRLLDVGSGPGTITVDLARRIAPGTVTALEATADALALTERAFADAGTTGQFIVGDAHDLPFEDDTFDIVHAHQVLQHIADPVQALREMRRVCRPDGWVAVRESDYSAFFWWPAVPEFDKWLRLYLDAARANGGEPDAGRMLLSWARAAGFTDPSVTTATWCFATDEDRTYWGGMWADRILNSALTRQLLDENRCSQTDLEAISAAFTRWSEDPDGMFVIPHGQLLTRP